MAVRHNITYIRLTIKKVNPTIPPFGISFLQSWWQWSVMLVYIVFPELLNVFLSNFTSSAVEIVMERVLIVLLTAGSE